jgi:hypothetical protein
LLAGVPIVVATAVPGHETVMRALEIEVTSFLSLQIERGKIKKSLMTWWLAMGRR